MQKFLLGSVALLALAIGPALAADANVKAPPRGPVMVPPAYDWAGLYIGIEGGGNWGRSRQTGIGLINPRIVGDITPDFDLSGGLFGGTIGFNYQVSQWVWGLETDLSWTNKKGSANDIPPFNPRAVSETHEQSIWTGRGRLGLTWDRWLAYVTGGAAAANAGIHTVSQAGITGDENRAVWGWTIGGGAETAFAQNWSIKGEFLYVDFGNPGFYNPPPNRVFSDRAGGIHLRDYIGRVGLNYKLDWGSPATLRY